MINLGKISKTRGIKGEVLHTSPGEGVYALGKGETLLLKSEKYEKQFIVEYSKNIRGGAVLKLQGVDSISSAFKLVGYAIHIDRPAEPEGEPDLCEFIVKDINGLEWGRVLDISEAGLNKLIEVYQNDDIYYVPFTDSIVKSIDAEKRLIIIDPPDGLMDLNKKDSATE